MNQVSLDFKIFVDNYIIHIGGNSNTNYFEVWQKNDDEDNSWIKRKANELGSLNKWNQRPAAFWVNENDFIIPI